MTDLTPLDHAHVKAEETDDPADRLAFWSRLAEAELSLVLEDTTKEDQLSPRVFDVDGVSYALAFDTPLRLASFAGEAPTATLPGRMLAKLLSDAQLGLGLNLEVAPSAQLLPPDTLDWLAEMLATSPDQTMARIEQVAPPSALPDILLTALDAKLHIASGAAKLAYLAQVQFEDGSRNHVLAFIDTAPGAEQQLALAVQEALALSGVDAGTLDVLFPAHSDPLAASLARHGLRIDLPDGVQTLQMGLGEGESPETPPKLR